MCPILCDPKDCSTPGFPVHHQLPKPAQNSHPSTLLILCHPLLLLSSIFPSIRVFSNESVLHIKWPNYWSFSFSITPSNVYLGWVSFRIDWFDLLAALGTLKSLLQHHSYKSINCSPLSLSDPTSHPYMTTGKTIALTIQTFFGKVISLLFNMLSRFVIDFLSRSKCLNFIAAVTIHSDFGTQGNKVCHCFHFCPFCLLWSDGTRCHDLSFWMLNFKSAFSLSSVTSSRGSSAPLHLPPLEWYYLHIWGFISLNKAA